MEEGILSTLRQAPSVEYDSSKGISMKELAEHMVALANHKPRKPEYILSKQEAEELPLWQLNWLGENCIVLTSIEISNIVKERFGRQVST